MAMMKRGSAFAVAITPAGWKAINSAASMEIDPTFASQIMGDDVVEAPASTPATSKKQLA